MRAGNAVLGGVVANEDELRGERHFATPLQLRHMKLSESEIGTVARTSPPTSADSTPPNECSKKRKLDFGEKSALNAAASSEKTSLCRSDKNASLLLPPAPLIGLDSDDETACGMFNAV